MFTPAMALKKAIAREAHQAIMYRPLLSAAHVVLTPIPVKTKSGNSLIVPTEVMFTIRQIVIERPKPAPVTPAIFIRTVYTPRLTGGFRAPVIPDNERSHYSRTHAPYGKTLRDHREGCHA